MSNKQSKRIRKLTKGFTPQQLRNVKRKYNNLPSTEKSNVLTKLEEFVKNKK